MSNARSVEHIGTSLQHACMHACMRLAATLGIRPLPSILPLAPRKAPFAKSVQSLGFVQIHSICLSV